jgi:hypothetical protein
LPGWVLLLQPEFQCSGFARRSVFSDLPLWDEAKFDVSHVRSHLQRRHVPAGNRIDWISAIGDAVELPGKL